MFVGHYSVSFAGKAAQKTIPLWLLFLAVQFLDVLWGIFVLLGIEKVRIVPGFTASNALDLYYMPYTHSLVAAVGWSALAYLVCQLTPRLRGVKTGMMVAAAVFSHWILDLIAHVPDLPIYSSRFKLGFGLWNYRWPEFILELVLLAFAAGWCFTKVPGFGRRGLIFAGLLGIVQYAGTFILPPPATNRAEAVMALFFYALFALMADWVERAHLTELSRLSTPAAS